MKKNTIYLFARHFLVITIAACSIPRQAINPSDNTVPPSIRQLADSILQQGLDHEALYTLLGAIKPVSSVVSFSYPLANTDTATKRLADALEAAWARPYLDSLQQVEQALRFVNRGIGPDVRLVMSPFRSTYGGKRILQVYAVRISLLDSLLNTEERFFGQFGLVPGADPAVVVNTIEYEDKYERLRGYGYLFGYPPYAVDFFVKVFHQSDTSGQQVERDFFQIPVHAREEGHFVYAIPKGHKPSADIDSVRYHHAKHVLESYRAVRGKYFNPADSTLKAMQLLREYRGAK